MTPQRILIVDDDIHVVNALVRTLNGLNCELYATVQPEEAIKKLYTDYFDIIITDQRMPKVTGLEILKEAQKIDEDILGILITGYSDMEVAISAINEVNLFRYIVKPWMNEELVHVVKDALSSRKERIDQISNAMKASDDIERCQKIIENFRKVLYRIHTQAANALLKTLTAKDRELYEHSVRVADYAMMIAKNLGIREERMQILKQAALFHDIGKVAIKDQILDKPDKLDEGEFSQIRNHPIIGYEILSELDDMQEVALIVCQHHERIDGGGYPFGVSGRFLMDESKILSVADCYDALTTERTYKKALDKDKALGILFEGVETQYDRATVEALIGGLYGR